MMDVFLWALINWGGNAIILCTLGEHRYKGWKRVLFWSLVAVGNALLSVLFHMTLPYEVFGLVAVAAALVLEIVPYICTTTGAWGKRFFYALNATCVVSVISVIVMNNAPILSREVGWIKLPLCIGYALVYLRFIRKPLEHVIRNIDRQWLVVDGVGGLFAALFYYCSVGYGIGRFTMLELCAVLVLNLAVYVGMFYTIHHMNAAIVLSQSQLQEEMLLGQVERLMDMEEQSRIMRHDLRHHNQAILTFAQKGQQQELLDYLADYDQSLTAESQPHYCNHPLVSNILGVYHGKATSAGIDFHPQVSLKADCGVGQRDLLGLLSNLLENALHGCDGKGEISLKLFSQDGKLVILCENTALTPVLFQEGIPHAKKRKSSGITSILRTVNHYDGMADFRQCQGVFSAHLILNLK